MPNQDQPVGVSFTAVSELWLGSWQAALTAVAAATQNGALDTSQAAAHKAAIADEREAVAHHFRVLLGQWTPAAFVPSSGQARTAAGTLAASSTSRFA